MVYIWRRQLCSLFLSSLDSGRIYGIQHGSGIYIILFAAMFSKEVLDMSFSRRYLLFTTIFRISLNVSSTTSDPSTGAPGNVVMTFGQFVGGGDMVVGAIIFIVLVIDPVYSYQ